MSPYMNDYGGDSYKGRARRTSLSDKNNAYSFRCLTCKQLQYFSQREITRAAILRCLGCGGSLEETQASRERHIQKMDAVRLAKNGAVEANFEPGVREVHTCKCCGSKWKDANAVMFHVTSNEECMSDYMDLRDMLVIEEKAVLRNTIHVFECNDEHILTAISTAGKLVDIKTFPSAKFANEALEEIFRQNPAVED